MPSRQVTAEATRRKWTKDIDVVIMECFHLSKPLSEDGKLQRIPTANAQNMAIERIVSYI